MSNRGVVKNPYLKKSTTNNGSTSERKEKQHDGISGSVIPSNPNNQVDSNTSFSEAFSTVSGQNNPRNSNNSNACNSRPTQHAHPQPINAVEPGDATALVQPHVLLVSTRQRGNGLLRLIRNVPFTYAKIVPDYIFGPNRCALFLSFKYHNLHPNYIHRRIAELKNDFDLRVLLCLVDVDDNASILLNLNKTCVVNNLTLTLAWSEQEAARYLETFKAFEGKDASVIQKKKDLSYSERASDVLGCVRSVNKTDAAQLVSQFGNFKSLATASIEELKSCPGIGEKKVRRLYDAFTKPFSSSLAKKRKEEREHLDNIEKDIADVENDSIEEYEDSVNTSQKEEQED